MITHKLYFFEEVIRDKKTDQTFFSSFLFFQLFLTSLHTGISSGGSRGKFRGGRRCETSFGTAQRRQYFRHAGTSYESTNVPTGYPNTGSR